jgi:hypothetical protein
MRGSEKMRVYVERESECELTRIHGAKVRADKNEKVDDDTWSERAKVRKCELTTIRGARERE